MRNKFNQIPKPKPKAKVGVAAVNPAIAQQIAAKLQQGLALHNAGQLEQARVIYDEILSKHENHIDALIQRSRLFRALGKYENSIKDLDRVIKLNPNLAVAYNGKGIALRRIKYFEKAIDNFDIAIKLNPKYSDAFINKGNALFDMNFYIEALLNYEKSIELNNSPDAHSGKGIVLQQLKQIDKSLISYENALSINSENANVKWNKALALLILGNFFEGWILFEYGWEGNKERGEKRSFTQPLWLGAEDIAGKTILLHAEQGLGDSIQFCRYAKLVAELGAKVILEVQKPLVNLLQNLTGVSQLVAKGNALPEFDYQCPLMSLPLAFKTELNSIPSTSAYLKNNAAKLEVWSKRLGEKSKPRIGLVWSGNSKHGNDHNRSLSLTDVLKHLPPNFEYVSLQKEVRQVDKDALTNSAIKHYGNELIDFTDTAALCDLMDIVISVDTSVAHLAGALGKTTWILLPYVPDWRWLLDRDDNPWYESVKLYRQDEDRQYAPVLELIANDLLKISSIT